MNQINLLEKYPNLIEKCRIWDCSYYEAIDKINSEKSTLLKYLEEQK